MTVFSRFMKGGRVERNSNGLWRKQQRKEAAMNASPPSISSRRYHWLGTVMLGLALSLAGDPAWAQAQPGAYPAPPILVGAAPWALPQMPDSSVPAFPAASGLDSGKTTSSSLFSCFGLTACCPDNCAPVNNI